MDQAGEVGKEVVTEDTRIYRSSALKNRVLGWKWVGVYWRTVSILDLDREPVLRGSLTP